MPPRIASAVLAATLVVAGIGVASAPAGAADGPAITVTPNAGLVDGQSVTVTGVRFTEKALVNDWAVVQCSGAILTDGITLDSALHDCDATTQPFVFAHADFFGNLSATFTVRKTFTTSSKIPVTCGQGADQCAILVGQLVVGGGFVGAAAPISFGPPPPSTIADCIREFAHDRTDPPRVKAQQLVACVHSVLSRRH
jgi:hypothetical protein